MYHALNNITIIVALAVLAFLSAVLINSIPAICAKQPVGSMVQLACASHEVQTGDLFTILIKDIGEQP